MYPDLSYVFHDLLGTSTDNWLSIFKTFGLLVVMAILAAAYFLRIELQRRATVGQFTPVKTKVITSRPMTLQDYVLNGFFGFILGFKMVYIFQHFPEMQTDPSGVILSLKGSWVGGLIGAALFSTYYYLTDGKSRQRGLQEEIRDTYPHHRINEISMVAVISGVVGAKLFTVIEDLPAFFADPMGNLLSGDGWTIYGGLIGGFLGTYIYLKRKNIPVKPVLDAVAPALIIAYGVGRMGCHFAGDGDWGIVAAAQPDWWFLPDWLWSYDYPRNVLSKAPGNVLPDCVGRYCNHLAEKVYPTAVYETLMAFSIGGILWALRKRTTAIPGLLFAIYLVFNGIERFMIEKIRVNDRYDFMGGLTQAEFIAVCLVLIGIGWGVYLWRTTPKTVSS